MANRIPLARVNGRTRQLPAGDQLDSAVLANAIAVVLTGLVTSNKSAVAATDTVLQAIGKLQAQSSQALTAEHVGTAPNQLPAVTHLGALAFMDDVGATQVQRHVPLSSPGHWWREYISDTDTVIRFHGFDGLVRTISEVGSAPNQTPSGQHLGANAFEEFPGMTLVYQHTPDAPMHGVWRERVSDTETVVKYRGSDGVIRSRQEFWT